MRGKPKRQKAIEEARAENPEDTTDIDSSNLYLQTKDYETYKN
jgi:hypothetical protein